MSVGNLDSKAKFAKALTKTEPCKRTRRYRKAVKKDVSRERRRDDKKETET